MPLDTSVFDKIKTFADYQKADQAFQLQKALQQQQIQTGGIDAASKSNIYATQLLSGAAAGGQGAYDQARQNLQAQGIDTSQYAPDVGTATAQLQAARYAQSPLGTLFNAAQKQQGNDIALGGLTGTITPGARTPMIPGLSLSPQADGTVQPTIVPQATSAAVPMQTTQPSVVPTPIATTSPSANAIQAINGDALALPVPPQPSDTAYNPALGDKPSTPKATYVAPATGAIAPFSFRPQGANESLPAYKDAQQQAFEQYKADPTYQANVEQGKAKAAAVGKAQGEAQKNAVSAGANYDQVVQTIGNIKDLVGSAAGLPQDRNFVPAEAQSYLSQNIGGTPLGNLLGVAPQAQADNVNTFKKLNEAQTISAMKELAASGQLRVTRPLQVILNRGYLIEPGSSNESKLKQADVILGELQNSKIAADNINTGLNGGQAQPYVSPLGAQPTTPSTNTPQPGMTMQGTDGTYLFNGGDPSVQSNWKKVK